MLLCGLAGEDLPKAQTLLRRRNLRTTYSLSRKWDCSRRQALSERRQLSMPGRLRAAVVWRRGILVPSAALQRGRRLCNGDRYARPTGLTRRVAADELDFDYESSFKLFLGYHLHDCADVRLTYWFLDTETLVSGTAGAGQTIVDPFGNLGLTGRASPLRPRCR